MNAKFSVLQAPLSSLAGTKGVLSDSGLCGLCGLGFRVIYYCF